MVADDASFGAGLESIAAGGKSKLPDYPSASVPLRDDV